MCRIDQRVIVIATQKDKQQTEVFFDMTPRLWNFSDISSDVKYFNCTTGQQRFRCKVPDYPVSSIHCHGRGRENSHSCRTALCGYDVLRNARAETASSVTQGLPCMSRPK